MAQKQNKENEIEKESTRLNYEYYCKRCGAEKIMYPEWIKEVEDFDNELIQQGRQEATKELLDDEIKFLSTYYNKLKTNKSILIEERLDYLRNYLLKLKEMK